MVPHLTTALTGPINELEQRILDSMPAIERWFRLEWMEHTPPFYTAVDIRNAGFKLAPVDTNLYPGGWNNLTPEMLPLAVQAAMAAIEKICPEARNLLLIPENHTRNTFYLSNVAQLQRIFHMAGLNVRIGSLLPEIAAPTDIALPNGSTLTLEPLKRSGNRLSVDGFDPCVVLLNNDLSAGVPDILRNIEQTLLPPLHAGWFMRRKAQPERSPFAFEGAGQAPSYRPENVGNDASARPWEQNHTAFDTANTAGTSGLVIGSALAGSQNWTIPAGFDKEGFLASAKANFITLQSAWDRADISSLRAMMTDEMLLEIQQQLSERETHTGASVNLTEVVMLEAQLLGIEDLGEGYMASVEFSGMIREEPSAGPNPFREVWNMTKPKSGSVGWLVAGVQALQ